MKVFIGVPAGRISGLRLFTVGTENGRRYRMIEQDRPLRAAGPGNGDAWTDTRALTRLISRWVDAGRTADIIEAYHIEVPRLIARAAEHNVLPSLAAAIQDKELDKALSDPLAQVLDAGYRLNSLTNKRFCTEANRIHSAFAAVGVPCVFLKGAARVAKEGTQAIGRRVTSDLDLLVPPERIADALPILTGDLGYTTVTVEQGAPRKHAWDHAWGVLCAPDGKTFLDLHLRVGPQTDLLTPEEALAERRLVNSGCGDVPVVSDTHWTVQAIFHAQIQDRHHARAFPGLRAHEDLAWSMVQCTGVVWAEISARFAAAGYTRIFKDSLALNRALFDSAPQIRVGWRENLHVSRVAATTRHAWMRGLTDVVVAVFHLLHKAELRHRFPDKPLWQSRLITLAGAVRQYGLNAPARLRFKISRYRSAHMR